MGRGPIKWSVCTIPIFYFNLFFLQTKFLNYLWFICHFIKINHQEITWIFVSFFYFYYLILAFLKIKKNMKLTLLFFLSFYKNNLPEKKINESLNKLITLLLPFYKKIPPENNLFVCVLSFVLFLCYRFLLPNPIFRN